MSFAPSSTFFASYRPQAQGGFSGATPPAATFGVHLISTVYVNSSFCTLITDTIAYNFSTFFDAPQFASGTNNNNTGFTLEDLTGMCTGHSPDIVGFSQLPDAPPLQSQDPPEQTPVVSTRPVRATRSPDRHTYPTGHVISQQKPKRVRRGKGG